MSLQNNKYGKSRLLRQPSNCRRKLLLGVSALATPLLYVAPEAHAQQSGSLLDSIVVTAQKREESAQDVGIAISAFSGEQLDRLGVVESTDIARFTPGVTISGSFAGQQKQFSIRGVTQNDFNDHVEAPNAVYIDDAYVAFQQGQVFATFDLDRAEVLKGPQGTLFGRNATGGLIHYITRRPTDEFEGFLDLSGGRFGSFRAEGAVSGAIKNGLRGRLSGLYKTHNGYLRNAFPEETFIPDAVATAEGLRLTDADIAAQPAGAGADLGGDETFAIRAQVEADLGADSTFLLTGFYNETTASVGPYQSVATIAELNAAGGQINSFRVAPDEVREVIGPGGVALNGAFDTNPADTVRPVPGGDFFGYIDPDGIDLLTSSNFAFDDLNTFETFGFTGKFETAFENGVEFVSITDYKHHEKFQALDLEAGPVDQFFFFNEADIDSFTQEFRFSGSGDNHNWVAGFYYLNIESDATNGFGAPATSVFVPAFDQPRIARLDTDSYSLFGQFERDLTDTIRFVGGVRGTIELKNYELDVISTVQDNPVAFDLAPTFPRTLGPGQGGAFFLDEPFEDSTNDKLLTAKAQLNWTPQDGILVYGGYNRGVKAGSFNSGGAGDLNGIQDEIPYDREVLNAYEIGIKSTFSGLRVNASAYYYDYKDYQASRWTGLANLITNNDAEFFGVDVDVTASPIDNLELIATFAYVNATVKDVVIGRVINSTGGDDIFPGTTADVRPTFVPEYTASGVVRYTVENVGPGYATIQGAVNYQSDFFHNLSNFDSTRLDGFVVADFQLSWSDNDDKWAVDAYVKNAFDERYSVIGFDLSQICGCNEEAQGLPRWWGVGVRRNF